MELELLLQPTQSSEEAGDDEGRNREFKRVMSVDSPMFSTRSRWMTFKKCYQFYLEEKKHLKAFLKSNCPRVCLSVDTWTSSQGIDYMSLTAHFIDKQWKLRRMVLNCCPISGHKGENVADVVEKCLNEWGVTGVFTVTMSNSSSNDVAVASMKTKLCKWEGSILGCKYMHIKCIARAIDLVADDSLRCMGRTVYRIRKAVKYVRESPSRLQQFKGYVEAEGFSTNALPPLDVPSRWCSTLMMLKSACEFQSVFERYLSADNTFRIEMESPDANVDEEWLGLPSKDDWARARKLRRFLAKFRNLMSFVSGASFVTCNAYFDMVCSIFELLNRCADNGDPELSPMAQNMKIKFSDYWMEIDKCNVITIIAAILDPRFKFEYVEFCLKHVHGDIIGDYMLRKVKDATSELFDAYGLFSSPPSHAIRQPSEEELATMSPMQRMKSETRLKFEKLMKEKNGGRRKTELEKYISEDLERDVREFDVLSWWKVHSPRFPILSAMARDVLSVPISSIASKSVFSTHEQIIDACGSSLTPKIMQGLISIQDWIQARQVEFRNDGEESILDIGRLQKGSSQLSSKSPFQV